MRDRIRRRLHALVDRAEHRVVRDKAELLVAEAMDIFHRLADAAPVVEPDVA